MAPSSSSGFDFFFAHCLPLLGQETQWVSGTCVHSPSTTLALGSESDWPDGVAAGRRLLLGVGLGVWLTARGWPSPTNGLMQ